MPNYSNQDYQKIISSIGFKEEKMIKTDASRGIFNSIGKIGEKKFFLRVVANSDLERIRGFKHELKVSNILSKERVSIIFPKSILVDSDQKLTWSLREYLEGESLTGYSGSGSVLFGYDLIKEKFLPDGEKIFSWLNDILIQLHKLSPAIFAEALLATGRRFDLDNDQTSISRFQLATKIDLTRQIKFYNANSKQYLIENQTPSIGDLVPANIIIGKSNYYLSDFEWFATDNKFFDIAFFWLFLWRYPDWQRKFLQNQIKSDQDKINFRLSIIRIIIACGWYQRLLNAGSGKNRHIWFKYLEGAGESFEAIINCCG